MTTAETYTTDITVGTRTPHYTNSITTPSSSPTSPTTTATTYTTDVIAGTRTPHYPNSTTLASASPTTNPTTSTVVTTTVLPSPSTVSPPSNVTKLYNGTGVSVSGARRSSSHYKIRLPGNTQQIVSQSLVVVMSGGQGDPDLYIQKGHKATRSSFFARSTKPGSGEEIQTGDLDIRNSSMYKSFSK